MDGIGYAVYQSNSIGLTPSWQRLRCTSLQQVQHLERIAVICNSLEALS